MLGQLLGVYVAGHVKRDASCASGAGRGRRHRRRARRAVGAAGGLDGRGAAGVLALPERWPPRPATRRIVRGVNDVDARQACAGCTPRCAASSTERLPAGVRRPALDLDRRRAAAAGGPVAGRAGRRCVDAQRSIVQDLRPGAASAAAASRARASSTRRHRILTNAHVVAGTRRSQSRSAARTRLPRTVVLLRPRPRRRRARRARPRRAGPARSRRRRRERATRPWCSATPRTGRSPSARPGCAAADTVARHEHLRQRQRQPLDLLDPRGRAQRQLRRPAARRRRARCSAWCSPPPSTRPTPASCSPTSEIAPDADAAAATAARQPVGTGGCTPD